MSQSESIAALAAALAKAQSQMGHASKGSVNPHFKNRYADLANVLDAVREPLAANGLAVSQLASAGDHGAACTTVLMHSSGEWIASTLELPVSKADAQGFGSALTYARRYSLAAICGIAQDDDDGEGARKAPPLAVPAPTKATPAQRTREQVEAIEAAFAVLAIPPSEWAAVAKREAKGLDPRTLDGAAAVLEGLDRMLTAAK